MIRRKVVLSMAHKVPCVTACNQNHTSRARRMTLTARLIDESIQDVPEWLQLLAYCTWELTRQNYPILRSGQLAASTVLHPRQRRCGISHCHDNKREQRSSSLARPRHRNMRTNYWPVDDVKVISIISLSDDVVATVHGPLEHGVQDLLHLFLQRPPSSYVK